MRVQRQFMPIWIERRWRRKGDSVFGYYRTPHGSYEGRIVRRYDGRNTFYISNPPECLWSHSHRQCFIRKGNGIFKVHFSRNGRTVDDGILAIERILMEAHEQGVAS